MSFLFAFACPALPAAGLFSRSRLRGTQAPRVYTTSQVWARSAPWRVLWAFKAAASWLFSRDRFPPSQSQARPWKPQTDLKKYIFCSPLLLFLKYHSSRQRLGSHGAKAVLQAFPLVTATNGASACGFASVSACACVCVFCSILQQAVKTKNTADSLNERCNFSFSLFLFCYICCLPLCTCITPKVFDVVAAMVQQQ